MKLFKLYILCFFLTGSIFSLSVQAENTSPFKLESTSTSFLPGTNLTLIVEKGVEASLSNIGDLFVARVIESAYAADQKTLLIPEGSWIIGRVVSVQSPSRISRAGKLSLELESLTTLTGENYPLNAILSFENGKVNQEGILDPQTGFKDKALQPTKKLLGSNTGQIVSIATLGLPVVVTLIGGSAHALISKGDNIGLNPGETFSIELKDNSLSIKE